MLVVFTSTSDTNLSPELVLVAFGGGFSSVSGTGAVAWSAVSAAFFAALFFFLRYSASWIYQKTRHHYSTTNLNLISHQIITQDLGNENSTFQTERADDGGNLRAFDFSTISKTIDGTTSLTQSGQCSLFNQTCLDKRSSISRRLNYQHRVTNDYVYRKQQTYQLLPRVEILLPRGRRRRRTGGGGGRRHLRRRHGWPHPPAPSLPPNHQTQSKSRRDPLLLLLLLLLPGIAGRGAAADSIGGPPGRGGEIWPRREVGFGIGIWGWIFGGFALLSEISRARPSTPPKYLGLNSPPLRFFFFFWCVLLRGGGVAVESDRFWVFLLLRRRGRGWFPRWDDPTAWLPPRPTDLRLCQQLVLLWYDAMSR